MNKIIVILLAMTTFTVSCSQPSNREPTAVKENLKEAKDDLKNAAEVKTEAAKAKTAAEWKYFKSESDNTILAMENDLKNAESRLEKATKSEKKNLIQEYDKAKSDFGQLKENLQRENAEFEKSMNNVGDDFSEKSESFKREFKHDMDKVGGALKNLFNNNVK